MNELGLVLRFRDRVVLIASSRPMVAFEFRVDRDEVECIGLEFRFASVRR